MGKHNHCIKHDYAARHELRRNALSEKYGAFGYGLYWYIMELLASSGEGYIALDEVIEKKLNLLIKPTDKYSVAEVIDFSIETCELFYLEEGKLFSYDIKIKKNSNNRLDTLHWKALSKSVFTRDNYTCNYCGKRGGLLECDHITPISKGGTNDIKNLTTSCRYCNRQKKDKSVDEFLAWRAARV